MPQEPVAQGQCIGELVGADLVLVHHLRPDLTLRVHSEERVVDHVAMVPRDVGGGPDRIHNLEVRMHDHSEGRLRRCLACEAGQDHDTYQDKDEESSHSLLLRVTLAWRRAPGLRERGSTGFTAASARQLFSAGDTFSALHAQRPRPALKYELSAGSGRPTPC